MKEHKPNNITITLEYTPAECKLLIYTNTRQNIIEYDEVYGPIEFPEILKQYIKYDM